MRISLPLLIFLLPMAASASPPPPFNASSSQTPSDPSSSDYSLADVNQTATAVFVILLLAFLLVGFVSISIRHCSEHRLIVLPLYSSAAAAAAARPRRLSPRGLDQAAIDSFPVFNFSEIKHLKIGKGALTCAVCVSEFEDNERLRLLPKCDHVFHPECIDPWLASHSTCPICRANLSEKIEPWQSTEVCNSTAEISEVQNHDQIAIAVHENERVDTESRERVRTLPRPHSTGHSLVRLGEDCEIYTLRLPEEVRMRRHVDRLDRLGKSDRWVFNMTLPFLSRTGSLKLTKVGVVDGEATGVGTSMKLPFECLAGMSEKIPTRLLV
ncbi:hypothetical protein Vadar_018187 [Vaccinium darrowii]|uniref:Uncharacterized protein n=1 Tax=Vaccinium darrowii TaxID=229202 RepID=A0ACB7YGE7_9ERIC|nr:hypothetical protein Vadar_018187 [Vaccinium darrowii]